MPERPGFNPEAEPSPTPTPEEARRTQIAGDIFAEAQRRRRFTPEEQQRRTETAGDIFEEAQRRRLGETAADANPREHPFTETVDVDARQERYRMTAYHALDNVRRITERPDGLDDRMTRTHLEALRDELNGLDLDNAPTAKQRDDAEQLNTVRRQLDAME